MSKNILLNGLGFVLVFESKGSVLDDFLLLLLLSFGRLHEDVLYKGQSINYVMNIN